MPVTPPPAKFIQQEKDGWGSPPRWTRDRGMRAKRSGHVYTDDPDAVLLAPNLPAGMSSYSAQYPNLVCVSIVPEHLGGKQWRVNCDYEMSNWSAGSASDPPPPEMPAETTYCNFNGLQESITMHCEVDDAGAEVYNGERINGGDGMPAYVGRDEIEVVRYYAAGQVPDINLFSSLNSYPKAVNAATVKLPPLRGTTQRWDVAAEKLLYMGYKLGVTPGGICVATHTLWFSQDHKYTDVITNNFGTTILSKQRRRYRKASMTALWPQ